jgi:hypothetical protein
MEKLDSYIFGRRPSRSRYAAAVTALIDEGTAAVLLKRGDDFDQAVDIQSVQGAISTQIRNRGKKARTERVDDNTLAVALDDRPARAPRSSRRRQAVPA